VPRDGARAAELFRQVADQGEVRAYYWLGLLYGTGTGLPQDYEEALKWYREGAGHGDPSALYALGRAYQRGQGVASDTTQALLWYILSERGGHKDAGDRIAELSASTDPATISEAQRLADAWQHYTHVEWNHS
jgi:TPR repeat protein